MEILPAFEAIRIDFTSDFNSSLQKVIKEGGK